MGINIPGTSSTFLFGNTTTFLSRWSASRRALNSATNGEEPRRIGKYGIEGVKKDLASDLALEKADSELAFLQSCFDSVDSVLIEVALFHLYWVPFSSVCFTTIFNFNSRIVKVEVEKSLNIQKVFLLKLDLNHLCMQIHYAKDVSYVFPSRK